MKRDLTELQQIYESSIGYETSMDLYIEQVLFNTDELYLEEGILDNVSSMVKNAGAKVKDAFDKYNPQELYNRAYVNISNKKAQLTKMHPTAAKLFKVAANPRNIKLAMMAITVLGALQGVDTSSAAELLGDLPADEQSLENVLAGQEALEGTPYDVDAEGSDVTVDFQGIDDHLENLVESGALDQQAADQILLCVEMQSGLEMGSYLEGVTVESYDKLIDDTTIITDDSGVTATGEETFESYVRTSVTDKNGKEFTLGEIRSTSVTDEAGNVTLQEENSGLKFDIINVMNNNIKELPEAKQEELWNMIMDRDMGNLDSKFKPVTESRHENDLIWESYITESNKQTAVADLKQLEAKFLNGLKKLATVMAQIASQKNIPVGRKVSAKQL
jgi:hypothetical protein